MTTIENKGFKGHNPRHAVFLMISCTLFTSLGQMLWKMGLTRAHVSSDIFSILNIPFLLGFLSYGIGAVLMLLAFQRGDLSTLYPIVATSYVWVTLLSPFLFLEVVSPLKWVGVSVIVLSVSILGLRGSHG